MVVVNGEAGIGKTSLVTRFASRAVPSSAAKAFSVGPYQRRKNSTKPSGDPNLNVKVR